MAQGNEIITSANPRGVFIEGIINGTDKPGTVMEIDFGVAAVGGRLQWQAYGVGTEGTGTVAADGNQRLIAVLLPDHLQGKTATDAYATGTRCFLYCPAMGETLNMLVANIAGTGSDQDFCIGDLFMVDDGTGKLIQTTGAIESEPFQCIETTLNVTADTLVHCIYTGY